MSKMSILSALFLLAAATGCAAQGNSSSPTGAPKLCTSKDQALSLIYAPLTMSQGTTPTSHFILQMKDQVHGAESLKNDLQQALGRDATVVLESIDTTLVSLHLPQNAKASDVLSSYINSNQIEFLEPDYQISHSATAFNDPEVSKQWAHGVVQSTNAWDLSEGEHVLVGVIDSGIDFSHPDLKANIYRNTREVINGVDDDRNGFIDDVSGWDFVNNNNNPQADDTRSYHGTHVSGTIGAVGNNGIGIVGQAPRVKILPLKYLDSTGTGFTSNAIRAIDYAIKMKVKVLSNSWGSFSSSASLQSAIVRARQAGILFVAAAGNGDASGRAVNTDATPFFPASYRLDNIVSVAASDSSDQLSAWSNYGHSTVDLAAPGVSIYSTRNNNSYASLSGTSMATPLVSGVAALVFSERPDLSPREVKAILIASVDKSSAYSGRVASGGRINAYKALKMARVYKHNLTQEDQLPVSSDSGSCP